MVRAFITDAATTGLPEYGDHAVSIGLFAIL